MNNYVVYDWATTMSTGAVSYYQVRRRTKTVDKGPGIDENGIPVDRRLVEEVDNDYGMDWWAYA